MSENRRLVERLLSDQEYQVLSELEGTLRLVLRYLRDLDAAS
jgi:hypothetical protein